MTWAALGCLAACLGLSLVAPHLGRSTRPDAATRLLAGISVATAGAVLWVVVLAAGTSVGQIPIVARIGEWSPQLLARFDPVPRWVAIGCTAIIAWALGSGTWIVCGQLRGLARLGRALAGAHPAGWLTVVDDPRGIAFATPAGGGRIVVSTGMLRALEPDERAVLLAHESAHVRHRDYWWVAAAHVAASVCPILRATARVVAQSAERWADEDAAAAVGDRAVVARALARAALHTPARSPRGAVAAAHGQILGRVEAMLAPPPVRRAAPVWILVILLVISLVTAWQVGANADAVFDRATTTTTVDG
jgi:Zn-dependent protease with chaperone function